MFIDHFVKDVFHRCSVYDTTPLEGKKNRDYNPQIGYSEQYIRAVPSQDLDGTIIECSLTGNNLKRCSSQPTKAKLNFITLLR